MILAAFCSPDRDGPTAHGAGRKRTEIAAIEAVRDIPVQQENLTASDQLAALPGRQFAAHAVTRMRLCDLSAVDGDSAASPANRLSRQGRDMFQQRHAGGEIAALRQKACERRGRRDGD